MATRDETHKTLMDRRSFLRAAAVVVPAAALPGAAASAMGVPAAGMAIGALGGCAANAILPCGPALGFGAAAAACMAAYDQETRRESVREQWLLEYHRHRIAARKGQCEREPAKLIWARKKLRDLRQQRGISGNAPAQPSNYNPRTRLSRITWKQREKRVTNALKRAGFKEWPWGGLL